MASILAFFTGVILAVMLQMNQALSVQYGAYHAALYIHLVGAAAAAILLLCRRKLRSAFQRAPVWMYLGGAFGVITLLCNNLSYGHISLTSIQSLGIFAQIFLSLLADRLGWLGRKKQDSGGMAGITIAMLGIIGLLDSTVQDGGVYILLSLAAGAAVIFTREFNAKLASKIGELQSSLMNYLCGLPLCLVLSLCAKEEALSGFRIWMWLGGVIGVINVIVCNVLVPRMPASQLTMLTLCGQLLSGAALDLLRRTSLNPKEFYAGLTITAGILISSLEQEIKKQKHLREKRYHERIAEAERKHQDYIIQKHEERRKKEFL